MEYAIGEYVFNCFAIDVTSMTMKYNSVAKWGMFEEQLVDVWRTPNEVRSVISFRRATLLRCGDVGPTGSYVLCNAEILPQVP